MTTGKRILLAFDGSGESAALNGPDPVNGTQFSNVLKLHLLAGGSIDETKTKEGVVPNQLCLYNEGVGGNSSNSKWVRHLNFILGNLGQQIEPLMARLEAVYEEGDELFLIGHSRGSSSARSFVSKLAKSGLRTASGKIVVNPPVKFLGCFDTVSDQTWNPWLRFGMYKRLITGGVVPSWVLGERDGKIADIVETAVHNVSLDDMRARTFTPVLMDFLDERVHEVWFPGAHADVGGGYYVDGVANVSGSYMKKFMEESGMVFLTPEQVAPENLEIPNNPGLKPEAKDLSLVPKPKEASHQQDKDCFRPILSVTNMEPIKDGTVRIHESLLDHLESDVIIDSETTRAYEINPNLGKTKFVVVGDLNKELPKKTAELMKVDIPEEEEEPKTGGFCSP